MKKILILALISELFLIHAAQATEPEIDNYDGRYAGARVYWDSSGSTYTRDLINTRPYAGDYSHQITYNKALGDWVYFGYDMGSGYDYSAYSHFGFYVYSVLNDTQIQINFLDDDNDEMRYGAQTVNQGAGWEQVSWRLSTGVFVANGDGAFEWDRVRRILFFIRGGNGVATGTFRMDEMQFYTSALAMPTLGAVSAPGLDGRYDLDWDDIAGAALYEIWEKDNSLFVDANSNAGSGWTSS